MEKTMVQVHPEVADNEVVRHLASDLATGDFDDDEVQALVWEVAERTGFEPSVLWDVLPELCDTVGDDGCYDCALCTHPCNTMEDG